jgi:hypothetical protein
MLKHAKKETHTIHPKQRKFKPTENSLDVLQKEIMESGFEYGDTNDQFEENIRETDEMGC